MTVKACDDKRKECNDLREKMKELQDRCAALSHSDAEYRSQMSVHQRQIDGLNHIRDKLTDENGQLKEELDKLRAQLNDHLGELSSHRTEKNRLEADHATRVQSLNSKYESIVRERAALKSRQAQLVPEVQNLRKQYQEQHDVLQRVQQELNAATSRAATSERTLTETQEVLRSTQAAEARAQQALEEERQRARVLHEKHASVEEEKGQAHHELQMLHKSRVELERHVTTLTEEHATLKDHAEQHRGNHQAAKDAHANERVQWEGKHEELKQDLESLATETRRRMRQHDEEKQGLMKQAQERQRLDHERYGKLQAEYRHLHELLQTTQAECSQQAASFEEERAAHDKRLVALQERLNRSEGALQELQKRATHDRAEFARSHSSLQENTLARTTQYVKLLAGTQAAVQHLGADATALRDSHQSALADLRNALLSLPKLKQQLQNPVTEWHAEVRRAFVGLIEKIQTLTRQAEDSKDALITAELQFQEERSKTLMLQEDKSRLSTSIAELQKRMDDNSNHFEEQLRAARQETRAATELKEMVEHNLNATQNDLEQMQQLMRTLQEDNQKLNVELGETQARQAEKLTVLEETLHNLQSRNRTLESDAAAADTEKEALRRSLNDQAETIRQLRDEYVWRDWGRVGWGWGGCWGRLCLFILLLFLLQIRLSLLTFVSPCLPPLALAYPPSHVDHVPTQGKKARRARGPGLRRPQSGAWQDEAGARIPKRDDSIPASPGRKNQVGARRGTKAAPAAAGRERRAQADYGRPLQAGRRRDRRSKQQQ